MSINPTQDTGMSDFLLERYAYRYDINIADTNAVAWIHAVSAATPPTATMLSIGTDLEPFTGSPVPVFLNTDATVTVLRSARAPAPVVAPEPIATAVVAETAPEPAVEATEVKPKWAFVDRFEFALWSDFQGRNMEQAIIIARFRILRDRKMGDVCRTVAFLTNYFGVTETTIRDWTKPNGPIANVVALRDYTTGGHITTSTKGELMWRFDFLTSPVAVVSDMKTREMVEVMTTPEGDHVFQIPRGWMNAHPDTTEDGNEFSSPGWSEGAIWAACAIRALSKGKPGKDLSAQDIAKWSAHPDDDATDVKKQVVKARMVANHLAAAEDAGLTSTVGSRSGRVRPNRRHHTIPLASDARTGGTRKKAWKAKDQYTPPPFVEDTAPPPF